MSAPARLLGLRVQGFKSFAERTMVEFGPGISAVVGPNGSGKSNLADALRWALGEQGRALRSRKSEDVIWAGSERRAALGMADVTLVLDNSDGLLPVDFSVLEIGRRLYRSGENDYLLNKQRVRLRDLVDLLDGANLADNAFLFIGQGMVDQALALRPEERRPLFEEVAGVRRHERRRRKAEDQLVESEANLARVEDILAELRPQARRLAAQAEQQATRETAATELADALLAAAHARWHEAAGRLAGATRERERLATDAAAAMVALREADEAAAAIATELGSRAETERERRSALDAARGAATALDLRDARLAAEAEAIDRDRRRLADEQASAEADLAVQRRALAVAPPARDLDLEAATSAAERALDEALAELGALRAASQAHGEEAASLRRAEAARQAEAETAGRRLAEADRRAADERNRADALAERRTAAERALAEAQERLEGAASSEAAARAAREAAAARLAEADRARGLAAERASSTASALAALEARLAGLTQRLEEDEARAIARAARRRGGRRVDEDLELEPTFRAAVEAALGDAARGYAVAMDDVEPLARERGVLVVEPDARRGAGNDPADRRARERAGALGGGSLVDAVRRDPLGAASALLRRCLWVPDLGAALTLRPELPAGWLVVVRDGSAVVRGSVVALGRPDGRLELRAQVERLTADAGRVRAERDDAAAAQSAAIRDAEEAAALADGTRRDESEAGIARRRAEDSERLAQRALEAIVRESAWHAAQAERLEADADRAREALAGLTRPEPEAPGSGDAGGPDASAIAAWEARVADLRGRRDRLAAELDAGDSVRRAAEAARAGAETAARFDEERLSRAAAELAALGRRSDALATERAAISVELASAREAETAARREVEVLEAADTADRGRLAAAERDAAAARERLRAADDRLRAADHAEVEARLGLDGLREQLLVELAGLGALGLARLEAADGVPGPDPGSARPDDGLLDEDAARLEAALDAAAPGWSTSPATVEPPSPGRLAQLRRRYHELGAANPFAVDEYAELKARLETLDGQASDLRAAIKTTRDLIDELNRMIAGQFESTFRALEAAFDRQFNRLFDGGYAKLSLTDPGDLSTTGVEIVARPPGKKPQALAMLSGGERALTAVALLFAMLEVRPVPFCVLDEVDAALDEANVGRFSEALRDLAERTQFVVITHNRGTIEAADALYGVTVADDSVSRVISLRLDEARAIAGAPRGSEAAGATIA